MWLTLSLLAAAQVPSPPTPDCGPLDPDACPPDFGSRDHLSWVREVDLATVRPAEVALGSGIGLDQAFRTTLGRWDAPVAILDSGIEWQDRRLNATTLLNAAELPVPQDAQGQPRPDRDGDGILTVRDYIGDPRVDPASGHDASDDVVDPSDLIATFSDGVDDDGNGFVDDIAGWDFFGDDNDPYAVAESIFSSHGTGMARDAAGLANDGGGLGVCPNCPVLPVRVGDSFIVDGDRVAQGVAYAVSRGAASINMSLGSLTHPEAARRAIRYAMESDVVIAAAAGDENGYHHNVPGLDDGILYVHSVTANTRGGDGAYSFFNTLNCNNYGPRLDMVASSDACASGATAYTSGAAALLVSGARDLGLSLSGDEVRALMTGHVDDVALTEAERAISEAYPSQPGWDAFYGAGRLDVGASMQAIVDGRIPPEVHFDSPRWFAWPDRGEAVDIEGFVDAPRSGSVSWTLEVGRGAEPTDWQSVASGITPVSGILATLQPSDFDAAPVADLDDEDVVQRMHRAHEPLVTVRLTAEDDAGNSAVTRRSIWMHRDADTLPGWPFDLGGSVETSPVLADFNGDGIFEVVLASSGGMVTVVDGRGLTRPGFPVYTPERERRLAGLDEAWHEGIVGTPSVGDVDGDGAVDVVVSTMGGSVVAWDADGALLPGFPVYIDGVAAEDFVPGVANDNSIVAAASLGDVDGDGALEIVVSGNDQRLYVWRGTGERFPGYPMDLCVDSCDYRAIASVSLGDVDGDGDLDAVVPTNEIPRGAAGTLWAIDLARAEPLDGWPVRRTGLLNNTVLPIFGEGHPSPTALADLDGDGDLEIVSSAMLGAPEVLNHDGTQYARLPSAAEAYGRDSNVRDLGFQTFAGHPGMGDMDGDGVPDIVMGAGTPTYLLSLAAVRWVEFDHVVAGWSGSSAESLPGWPRQNDDVAFLHAPGIADVDGDGAPEALFGSSGFFLNAWNAEGEVPDEWPKNLGGWIISAPAIGDIDGDGLLDVVAAVRNGYVFAFRTRGRADQDVGWAMNHHDAQNTGNFGTPLPQQMGPVEVDAELPCGCRALPTGPWPVAGLLALLLLARRRSRYGGWGCRVEGRAGYGAGTQEVP